MEQINGVRLVLSDSATFKDSISSICTLISEANIVLKPTHLEIVAMEAANVGMIIFKMTASEFSEYKIGEKESSFGLKLGDLKQILSRGKDKDQVLTLSVEGNQLKISFSGKIKKDFTLPLIDVDKKVTKIPDLKFNAEITIDNSELRDAVEDVAIVADAVDFKVEQGLFIVSGAGDQSKAISETRGVIKVIEAEKTAHSKFSLEYVNKMLGTKLSKTVKVSLGVEYPLKLSYINDKASISIVYILAPRVSND